MVFKLISMFRRKEETDTLAMFKEVVSELRTLQDIFANLRTLFDKGNYAEIRKVAALVSQKEFDMDGRTRKIMRNLYEGAFLPDTRQGLYWLTNSLDDVVDALDNVTKYLIYLEGKRIPLSIKKKMSALIETIPESLDLLERSLNALLNHKNSVDFYSDIRKVEHDADILKKEVLDIVFFDKNLDYLSSKMIVLVTGLMESVSDAVEECNDRLQVLKFLRKP